MVESGARASPMKTPLYSSIGTACDGRPISDSIRTSTECQRDRVKAESAFSVNRPAVLGEAPADFLRASGPCPSLEAPGQTVSGLLRSGL